MGIESGSARILQLIQKGISLEDIESAIQNMAGAGLAVEAMCFTDFPTESHADAMATLLLLDVHHEAIALFMCGRFQLTEGSAVFARPSAFGIHDIWHVAGDDLRNTLYYQEQAESKTTSETEDIDVRLDGMSRRWVLHHYPWAGSLSTAHTLLWYEKLGPQIFKHLAGKSDRRLSAGSGVFTAELPVHVKKLAERAYENEARIWYTLIHEPANGLTGSLPAISEKMAACASPENPLSIDSERSRGVLLT